MESYIKKFSLGKIIAKTKIKYDPELKILHSRSVADNMSFLADVILKNFNELGSDDAVICVGDCEKFKSIISPFTDEIKLSLNFNGTILLGMNFSSDDIETYYGASDPIAIPKTPIGLGDLGTPNVVIPFSDDFTKQFLKAKVALDETALFSIAMNKKEKVEFVFGYLTSNSHKIRISPPLAVINTKLSKGLQFPVTQLAEAFKMNTDMSGGELEIFEAEDGMIRLNFKSDLFECTYFQFSNTKPK